jgi:hypothetical protein
MLAALLAVAISASSPAPAPAAAPGAFAPDYRSGCIRNLREFAYALSSAVESGDVNRLAALYRWQGLSTRQGYDTMARLQEIVARPLLEVTPVYPQRQRTEVVSMAPYATHPDAPGADAAGRGEAAAGPAATGAKVFPPLTGPPMFEVPLPAGEPLATEGGSAAATASDPLGDTVPRLPPVALRLDQTLANGVTATATTFRLQRDLGCWWVSL